MGPGAGASAIDPFFLVVAEALKATLSLTFWEYLFVEFMTPFFQALRAPTNSGRLTLGLFLFWPLHRYLSSIVPGGECPGRPGACRVRRGASPGRRGGRLGTGPAGGPIRPGAGASLTRSPQGNQVVTSVADCRGLPSGSSRAHPTGWWRRSARLREPRRRLSSAGRP